MPQHYFVSPIKFEARQEADWNCNQRSLSAKERCMDGIAIRKESIGQSGSEIFGRLRYSNLQSVERHQERIGERNVLRRVQIRAKAINLVRVFTAPFQEDETKEIFSLEIQHKRKYDQKYESRIDQSRIWGRYRNRTRRTLNYVQNDVYNIFNTSGWRISWFIVLMATCGGQSMSRPTPNVKANEIEWLGVAKHIIN